MESPFTVVFVAAAVLALIMTAIPERIAPSDRKTSFSKSIRQFDAGAVVLVSGLVGSKLLAIALRPAELRDWTDFLAPNGGLLLGAILLGSAGLVVFAMFTGEPLLGLADGIALPGAILALGSWIGCALDGCAYGRRTAATWITPPGPDYLGIVEPRWPTQTIGALSALAILAALLFWVPPSASPGVRSALTCMVIGLSLTGVAALRGDPVGSLVGVRVDSLAGIALLAMGGLTALLAIVNRSGRTSV